MRDYEDQWVRDIVDEIERINWYEIDRSFYRLKYHDLVIAGNDLYIIDRTLHDVFYIELRYTYEKKYKLIPHYRDHTFDSYFRALALFIDEVKEIL